MIDAHKITEQASLLSHRFYAELVEEDRTYIDRARNLIASEVNTTCGTIGEQAWMRLLTKPWRQIRHQMLADTPQGRLLRSNSPFSRIIGISDPQTRRQVWRQAKHDLSVAMI